MTIYLNRNKIPINLFNYYDSIEFISFNNIKEHFKINVRVDDYKYFIGNLFKDQRKIHLFRGTLHIFPFLFFTKQNLFSKDSIRNGLSANPNIMDINKLYDLFCLRLNLKKIQSDLKSINDIKGNEVFYSAFVSQLFIVLYKYSFYQISDSLSLNEHD